ncbi:hypothetical protein DVQ84_09015 [Yersinia enterocolitica]|nr:hypothetical protein [Yersinia enterocolitica]QBQ00824.1 hypothetical protein YEY1_20025 [Yersinia enterocolitica subsp. palearctica]EKN5968134.1 hypothetical protein [Yersinia enterocolitica]EKN5972549.1 hypothetical protein [Yersinia enterocolitica]EKN6020560.1 hypothetical protein [Yersinia enterocolitica]
MSIGGRPTRYPIDFKVQEGGQQAHPDELTSVSDSGDRAQPTHLQLERWRVSVTQAQTLTGVRTILNTLPPRFIIQIP